MFELFQLIFIITQVGSTIAPPSPFVKNKIYKCSLFKDGDRRHCGVKWPWPEAAVSPTPRPTGLLVEGLPRGQGGSAGGDDASDSCVLVPELSGSSQPEFQPLATGSLTTSLERGTHVCRSSDHIHQQTLRLGS